MLAALGFFAAAWIAYFAVGRERIADLYSGRVTSAYGVTLEGRSEHPIEFYYRHAESLLITASWMLLVAVIYLFFLIRKRREIVAELRREHGWHAPAIRESFRERPLNRARWIVMLGLLLAFFVLYAWQGSKLLTSPAVSEDSLLFGADPRFTANDMTNFRADYYSTPSRHPLFVLMTNPPGSLLSWIVSPFHAALILNSLFGALGAALAFLVFDRWRQSLLPSLALALFFGVTMSQMFFGSLPVTYALAACSLLVLYGLTIISIQQKRVDFWPWVVAGVVAMGVTATNAMQAVICFAFAARVAHSNDGRPVSALVLLYTVELGAIVIVLAVVQKAIYPAADLFFWPFDQRVSLGYVDYSGLAHPFTLIARELKHFVLVNIVGPLPQPIPWPATNLPALTYDAPLRFLTLGWISAGLWFVMLITGIVAAFRRDGESKPVLRAFLLCIVFSFLLHSFYGIGVTGRQEIFLYSAHWTFLVLFLATAAWAFANRVTAIAIAGLAAVLAINNISILRHILSVYTSP